MWFNSTMRNKKLVGLIWVAAMTAVLCILAPIAIPIPGPVPLSFASLAVFLIAYALGWKRGLLACGLWLLLGLAGLPVFSGFTGGFSKIFGPTGGYLVGFLPLMGFCGYAAEKWEKRLPMAVAMVLGTVLLYLWGSLWLTVSAGMPFGAAVATGVLPFLPGDILKMGAALAVGPVLRRRLKAAGFAK